MDVTSPPSHGRQIIESYGAGRFQVSGVVFEGSLLVFPERSFAWPVASISEVDAASLAAVGTAEPAVEILLLGCGPRMALVPKALRQALRAQGVVIEAMDTGAACRTYNVLISEERRAAAALIAMD